MDAQELFYFMILPVWGTWSTWSSCPNEGKAWTLHRSSWNFAIWQLWWMLSHEPWENPSWGGGVPLVTTWNYRCYCFAENWSWKTKWELSALVSTRSLDQRATVEGQINGLYLTSWCRHYNTVFGSKRCIRRTQCHRDALWRYVFLPACSSPGSTKLAPGLTFRWWTCEMHPVHQICMQERHCQVPIVARYLIGSDMISYL